LGIERGIGFIGFSKQKSKYHHILTSFFINIIYFEMNHNEMKNYDEIYIGFFKFIDKTS